MLHFWRQTKSILPQIVTGAWRNTTGEENPIGALYNLLFVRVPVLCASAVYVRNSLTGHPLVVDLGNGAFEMSPFAVFGVLFIILGPPWAPDDVSDESV